MLVPLGLLESFTPASYQHYITTLAQLPSLEAQTDLLERWLAGLGRLCLATAHTCETLDAVNPGR